LEKAIKLNSKYSPSTILNRGHAKELLGDPDGAMKDYDKAIRLNSKYAGAFQKRGALKKKQGDKQGGKADLDRAKKIDPTLFKK